MGTSWLIAAALVTPVVGAAGVLLARRRHNIREAVSICTAALLLALVGALVPTVGAGERPGLTAFEMLPGIGLRFTIEPLGLGFALIAALLWLVTVIYAVGYMRAHGEEHQTRFYAFFALAIAATVGAAFAGNLLTLYLFYEALTLATYPLVTHGGTDKDRAGGRTYLMVLLGTSLTFLLLALAWTYVMTGTLEFAEGGIFTANDGLVRGASPIGACLVDVGMRSATAGVSATVCPLDACGACVGARD